MIVIRAHGGGVRRGSAALVAAVGLCLGVVGCGSAAPLAIPAVSADPSPRGGSAPQVGSGDQQGRSGNLGDNTGPSGAAIPKILWSGQDGRQFVGYSGSDMVFATAGQGSVLYAVNAVTGAADWTLTAAGLPSGSFTGHWLATNGFVYGLAQEGPPSTDPYSFSSADTLVAFAVGSNRPAWSSPVPGTLIDPLLGIAGGDVQVKKESGGTYHYVAATGKALGMRQDVLLSAPGLANHDGLYLDNTKVLRDASSGSAINVHGQGTCGWNKTLIVTSELNALDRATGTLQWTLPPNAGCLDVTDNGEVITASSSSGVGIVAFKTLNSAELWSFDATAINSTQVDFVGGGLFLLEGATGNSSFFMIG